MKDKTKEAIQQGLKDIKKGRVKYIGSFAKYLKEDT